jgi:hypothetical protein
MRTIGFVFLSLFVTACAGGGDSSSGDGQRGNTSAYQRMSGGAGGAGATGSGGSFGNTDVMVAPSLPMMLPGSGGANGAAGSSGPCVAGQFCAPTSADGDCGTLTLDTSVKMIVMPGNVLLIWDRSTSMTENWNGMQRWQGAGTGLINALTPIQDLLTIGAIFFPAEMPGSDSNSTCLIPGCSCSVDAYTSSEQLAFQPGAMALQKLQGAAPSGVNPMYGPVGFGATTDPNAVASAGQTPTSEAVAAADVMLQGSMLTGTTAAVLVTDGEPNCGWDQTKTTTMVAGWLSQFNIKTYVVGLPGAAGGGTGPSMGGNGAAVLNAIAQAGGTDQYIDAADTMTLQTNLMNIVASTVVSGFDSCSIDLTPAADPPDKLQLVLTETVMGVATDEAAPHDLGNGGGWSISDDGKHVELLGSLCTDATGGRFEALKFTYGCKELPPLPPTPPVE